MAQVLSVDIGSSSVRAAVYDQTGQVLPATRVRVPHTLRGGAGQGAAELDPEDIVERVASAVDGTLRAVRSAGVGVDAVAMSVMWHGVCGVDRAGRVTVPVLTWADQRAADAAGRLRTRLDAAAHHARTGTRLHTSYLPAKLAWLATEHPELAAATTRWLSPAEFVYLRLFGSATVSVSMASGTGLFDQHRLDWDTVVLEALAVDPETLSTISDEPARGLLPAFRARWPELADLPWYPAIGDGAAANVGTGCVGPDRLAVTIGTSAAVRVLWETTTVRVPAPLWCYRLDAQHAVMGGALNDGGNLVAWLRTILALPADADVERQLAAAPPGGHGLDVLPLLSGERSTGWHDCATGAIYGLGLATGATDVLRAAMEAVALRVGVLAEDVCTALPAQREVVASGAALDASPAWRQMVADAVGRPVRRTVVGEASARGAALWVLHRLGVLPSLRTPVAVAEVTHPDPRHQETYQGMLARQQRLYGVVVEPS